MTNHVHLVIEPGKDVSTVSQLMKRLAGRQSALVNKLERRTGSLWDGRFKASPIQRDEYMLSCIRYVEMNPVRAGMVVGPRQYRWSSYRERMGLVDKTQLDYDTSFLALADECKQRRGKYKEYMQQSITNGEMRLIRTALQRNKLTGNARFTDEIEERIGERIESRDRGRPVCE